MHFSRFVLLGMAVALVTGCEDDKVTVPTLPPFAQVRVINAVADTGAIDVRFIDQVDLSLQQSYGLGFRQGSIYEQVESKSRRLRVFPASLNISVTSQVLLDTTITIEANKRLTLLVTGPSRTAGNVIVRMIEDDVTAPPAGQVAVRMVNASTGATNGYVVNAVGDAISGTPTFANVGAFSTSPYVNRTAGATALRVTDVGSVTARASVAAPSAPAEVTGAFPGAGINSAGSSLSAYFFPAARAGSVSSPGIVWFVDRNPCDAGC